MSEKRLSTRQLLERIPNVQNLYRHKNGTYYGIKKIGRKRKEHSLGTTDRKLAERKLKQWLEDLQKVDGDASKITISTLLDKLDAINIGKAVKTRKTDAAIRTQFEETFEPGVNIRVSDIRPSHLNEWLAKQEGRLKNTSYNRYAGWLKQLFEIAVDDRIIANSPFDSVKTKWKKPQKPRREIPTQEQFETIVQKIRSEKFNADAKDSGDFVEFLGLAGLGQAEAGSLTWGDIDWDNQRISIRRQKTNARFFVPIYPHLRPFLERLRSELQQEPGKEKNVFKIKDPKKALKNTCVCLGYPNFSPRNIRQVLIRRLWQSGVDYKLISRWQGHQDGGKLILDTYTEVFAADDESYESQQLQKIK